MDKITKQDRDEFAAFCHNATTTQLRNILDKEEGARRIVYATIARKEMENRNHG